ncbi:hypothetical protein BD779DRAFT_1474131 [Infundibulicybe gibba]|nr:hypothetical protein BD779DRAFT_1474131 [Infundibulicybe gibba]
MFPLREDEARLVQHAWEHAFEIKDLEFTVMDYNMFRVVRGRGPQIRGEAKTKIIPLVESVYGFDSRRKPRIISANRELAAALKNGKGFLYQSIGDENEGLYYNIIIQKSINALWFTDAEDEGVRYPQVFGHNGMLPMQAIAFVLTVIEFGIDMWRTGIKKDLTFKSSEYRTVYMTHVDLLLKYEAGTKEHDLCNRLRRRLYRKALIGAGVDPQPDDPRPIIPASAYSEAMQQDRDYIHESSESDEVYKD